MNELDSLDRWLEGGPLPSDEEHDPDPDRYFCDEEIECENKFDWNPVVVQGALSG